MQYFFARRFVGEGDLSVSWESLGCFAPTAMECACVWADSIAINNARCVGVVTFQYIVITSMILAQH